MNDVKSRVSAFLKTKNIEKQNQIASILNISAQAVSGIYNNKSNFTADQLIVLLNMYQDLDARWLLTGQGSMYNGDDNQTMTQEPTSPYLTECKNPLCAERIFSLQEQVKLLREMNDLLKAELNRKVDPPEKKASGGVESGDYGKTG